MNMKMKSATLGAIVMLACGGAAQAQTQTQVQEPAPKYKVQPEVVIVERGEDGRASAIIVDDQVYRVCDAERERDCIQPRAAGLGWGDRPLGYWPGQEAEGQHSTSDKHMPGNR